jgi:hypothetical protein
MQIVDPDGDGDTVVAGDGSNLIFGDNARITTAITDAPLFGNLPITLGLVTTYEPGIGGSDDITTGLGEDIIFGGFLDDIIVANDGEDYDRDNEALPRDVDNIVLGDNGFIDFVTQEHVPLDPVGNADPIDIDRISTTDPNLGGLDTITTGAGNDFILGGTDDDTIRAGAGNDLVFGDHGLIEAATTTTTLELTREMIAGEVWTIWLTEAGETEPDVYAVAVGDIEGPNPTLADMARALAAAVNNDTGADYLATTDGGTVVLVNLNGNAFSTVLGIAPLGSAAVDDATATTATVLLTGAPVAGEIWTITLDDTVTPSVHAVPIAGGESLADVAVLLADSINASGLFDVSATADGDYVVIASQSGVAFTTTFEITPVGSAVIDDTTASSTTVQLTGTVVAGDVWTVVLDDGVLPTVHLVPIVGGETLAQVAAALAGDINDTADADFTASADGAVLVITNRTGISFGTTLEVISGAAAARPWPTWPRRSPTTSTPMRRPTSQPRQRATPW